MTGRLWSPQQGVAKPTRMIGEQHRPTSGKGKADCVCAECTHALERPMFPIIPEV